MSTTCRSIIVLASLLTATVVYTPMLTESAAAQSAGSSRIGRLARGTEWELDFRPGALRLFTDATDGKAYWYFVYKVVNRSGRERMWAPRFELFTDKGAIQTSGKEIPSRVTASIMSMLGNPLLQNQNQAIGEILVGEENAKEGVIIWAAEDTAITEFTVFVTGISGKVRKVPDPKSGEPRVERWTVRFNYLVPGNARDRGSVPVLPAATDEDVKDGADRRATDFGVWLWR